MKKFAIAGVVMALLTGAAVLEAQDPGQPPSPEKEHQWLQQLVGEWETEAEAILERLVAEPWRKVREKATVRSWPRESRGGEFEFLQRDGVRAKRRDRSIRATSMNRPGPIAPRLSHDQANLAHRVPLPNSFSDE